MSMPQISAPNGASIFLTSKLMVSFPLRQQEDILRSLERGATLVGCPLNSSLVVVQMPRGNLEARTAAGEPAVPPAVHGSAREDALGKR